MDKNSAAEEAAFMRALVARYEAKQAAAIENVKQALLEESDRLISFWGSQVEDLDAEIEQAIQSLEGKHVEEMQSHFVELAAEANKSRPHYTGTLLELKDTAQKLCEQARLMDAVVEKMKQHRRQQVVTKQKDRERLQSRIRLALARLAREQRDEMVRLKKFVQVLVLKARGLIA